MATKTFEELKQLAIQIRDEKTNKQNTATRVGTAMLEHINKLEQDYYDKTKTDEELKERDDKLTELDNKIGSFLYSVNVPSGMSKKVLSLSEFAEKKAIAIVTGSFTQFGYYYGEEESDFTVLGNNTKSGVPIEFTIPSNARDFFVYNTKQVGTTEVKVELFVNQGYDERKNSEEIEGIIKNTLFGFGFGYGGYVEMNNKEKKFSTNFQYVTCNTTVYTPTNAVEKDYVSSESRGLWFLMFNITNKEFNVYYYNILPKDKIKNFIIATGINDEISFSTSSINPSQKILEDLKREIGKIKNELGGKIYKNVVHVASGMAEKVVSLSDYPEKQAIVKVIGKFMQFGYYYGESEEFTVLGRKSNELIEFQIPSNAKEFFVYNTAEIGDTDVEVEIYLQKDDKSSSLIYEVDILKKEIDKIKPTKGCVFMSLGDSISTESYYMPLLRDILQPSKYYNLAVGGAHWADYEDTIYDGNPVLNGEDNNHNNVIGNQLQKIINNPETYDVAPDIIIIAAGTNDSLPMINDSDDVAIKNEVNSKFYSGNSAIPITTPTFDESDTYKEYRKTIAGAMRYVVCTLQKMYPNAVIFILTPIQGAYSIRNYGNNIRIKQEYITEVARHLAVEVIHVGEECGIQADFEYQGAMWTEKDSVSKEGRDLIDGLHPNNSGNYKMANYIAKKIMSYYGKFLVE